MLSVLSIEVILNWQGVDFWRHGTEYSNPTACKICVKTQGIIGLRVQIGINLGEKQSDLEFLNFGTFQSLVCSF